MHTTQHMANNIPQVSFLYRIEGNPLQGFRCCAYRVLKDCPKIYKIAPPYPQQYGSPFKILHKEHGYINNPRTMSAFHTSARSAWVSQESAYKWHLEYCREHPESHVICCNRTREWRHNKEFAAMKASWQALIDMDLGASGLEGVYSPISRNDVPDHPRTLRYFLLDRPDVR